MVSQNTLNVNIFISLGTEQRAICWAVTRLFVCNSVEPGEMKLANTVLLSTLIWRISIDFFFTSTKQQYLNALIDPGNKPGEQPAVQILSQSITGIISLKRRKKKKCNKCWDKPKIFLLLMCLKGAMNWVKPQWAQELCPAGHQGQAGRSSSLPAAHWGSTSPILIPGKGNWAAAAGAAAFLLAWADETQVATSLC